MPVYDYDLISCYSEDTEALSISGWKLVKDLFVGESILAFNAEDERCRFQPVEAMNRSLYKGLMVHIEADRHVDLLVTPNHRVILSNHARSCNSKYFKLTGKMGWTNWQVYEAGDMPNGNIRIPVSYPIADREDYIVSNEMLKLIAWINTEGWQRGYSVKGVKKKGGLAIAQSEARGHIQNCEEIEDCLIKLNIKFTHKIRDRKGRQYKEHEFYISFSDSRKLPLESNIHIIPLWILQNCSLCQLKLYFDTLIKGDGNVALYKKAFTTILKDNADKMMFLAQLLGYKCKIGYPARNRPKYDVYINDRDRLGSNSNPHKTTIQFGRVKQEYYEGMVSCPTVKDGFIIVRRNGRACICGNSFPTIAKDLVDIRDCKWIHSPEYHEEAVYGFVKCEVTIYDWVMVSPIIMDTEEALISPTGAWETHLTKSELDFITKWKVGSFVIKDGWWAVTSRKAFRKPLKAPMGTLLEYKQGTELQRLLAKRMSTGIYGKLGEERSEEFGPFFNPVWFSYISTNTRLQVADFLYSHDIGPGDNEGYSHLLCISVDGFMLDCPIEEAR